MRLLLIEDHQALREMTRAHLAERGFTVDAFASVADGLEALAGVTYDVLIVDLGLPDGDGVTLLRANAERSAMPAVVLTARDQVEDKIGGLDAGADDYVVKPVDLGELEARIRAVLRRPGARQAASLQFDTVRFDTRSREVWIGEEPLQLPRRESLLLEHLMRADGRVVVRDLLEERLYGYEDEVTPNALEAAVSRLRRSLADAGARITVEAQRGVGYRLRALGE